MGIRVFAEIKNTKRLLDKFKKLEADALQSQVKAVQDSVFLIHRLAVESIQENSSGTPAIRYSNGRKRNILISKPGEPPNTDTGRLVQSIKFDFKNKGLIGRVGTNLKYGAALEFGTKKMTARPWLSRAVREAAKEVADIFKNALKATVKGATK